MNIVIICIEVNNYWLQKQKNEGKVPFAEISDMLTEQYPQIQISTSGNKVEIKNTQSSQNIAIRESIKNFFTDKYNMSISDGDYSITTIVRPVYDQVAEINANEDTAEDNEDTVGDNEELPDKAMSSQEVSVEKETRYFSVPELDAFLTEFSLILSNAKKFHMPEVVWSANILLSMDSGYGISTVNDRIADLLSDNGYLFSSKTQKRVVEYSIPEEPNEADHYWEIILKEIGHYYREEKDNGKRSSNAPLIFYIDISECFGETNEKKLRDNLIRLAKIKGSFLFTFRIPYIEGVALAKTKSMLSDIFMIRQIVIPPYLNDVLIQYIKKRLVEKGFVLQDGLDEMLEKLIAYEKQDGHFNGLKTIDRLSDDIIYNKLAVQQENECLSVSVDDLVRMYNILETEDNDPEEALSRLCGMENVKRTIDEIIAQIQLYNELKNSGKKLSAPTMHMRFVGNPGTGKTTVARLVAQLFKQKGILNKGYFYEIKARDLCGRYVGETAPKTSRYCKDALGSVLFIDEAYTLYRGEGRADYGQEAIETLVTEMENNRDNLVVIMAGYKKEMDELLESNSGLAGRMPYEIEFRNYTKEELVEIFYTMLGDNFSYSDGFDQRVREFIDSIPDSMLQDEEFSNARMIRNLYERIWSKAAYRRSVSKENDIVLQEDDVQRAVSDEEFQRLLINKNNKIGF